METVKSAVSSVKSNLIGAIVGGVATFMAVKKFSSIDNKWAVYGLALVGAVAGATVQAKIKSKHAIKAAATK